MPRIDYPDKRSLPGRARNFFAGIPLLNVFRLWQHSPDTAVAATRLGASQLADLKLHAAHREMVILTCSRIFEAQYEWDQHVGPARTAGVSEAQLAAIRSGEYDADVFEDSEQALLQFAYAAATQSRPSKAVFDQFLTVFDDRATVEVVGLVGHYFMIARMATVFDVESDSPGDSSLIDASRTLSPTP